MSSAAKWTIASTSVARCCRWPTTEYRRSDWALKYLARYLTGTAIKDGRIIRDDGQSMVIRVKDYRRACERQLAMPGEEFVARFVFHILPRRMQRMRFAGLFQPIVRKRRVAVCHRLLAGRDKPTVPEVHRQLQHRREPAQEPSPKAAEATEPLRRDPATDAAGAHEAAADQASPHAAGTPDVPWEPERPPRTCPRCLMPGLQFMGRLRPDEALRFIGRLDLLLRSMINIVTTLEVPPLRGRQRRPPPFGDAPVEWVLDVGCDVRAAHICTVIDTLPAPDT